MMRVVSILIIAICFSLKLNAQSKKEVARYGIIECLETKALFKDGKETHRFTSEKTSWDKKGNLILNEKFSKNGELESKETYVWKGKELVEEKLEKLIKEKESKIKFDHIKYFYKYGLKLEEQTFNQKGSLISKTTFKYNRFGDKIEESEYSPSGDLIKTSTYAYDKKGLRVEKLEKDKNQTIVEKTSYSYSFR